MNVLIVLLTLFTINPEPTYSNIRKQIDLLGSETFEERQIASQKLKEMGQPAIKVLLQLQTRDSEIKLRRDIIITNFIDSYQLLGGILPWIDCLPEDYPNREKIIKESMIHKYWHLDIPNFKSITDLIDVEDNASIKGDGDFNGYRWGTKVFVLELIKNGKTDTEIRDLLKQMRNIESQWQAKGGRYLQFDPFKPNPKDE